MTIASSMAVLLLPDWAQDDIDRFLTSRKSGTITINLRAGEIDSVDVRATVRAPKKAER
jgi:hypothetical protein